MINVRLQKLTKDFILSHITQEQIFEKYLGIPIQFNLFKNPLRIDNYPTCSFKYMGKISDGRDLLWFNDFSQPKGVDCFGLVQKIYNNCSFYETLEIIGTHFKLLDIQLLQDYKYIIEPSIQREIIKKIKHDIKIKSIEFTRKDKEYWNQYHLELEDLSKDIKSIKCYWLDDNKYNCNLVKPNYAYDCDNYDYKLYFPLVDKKKEIKFLHNNAEIFQGDKYLKFDKPLLIITSSYKDVQLLKKIEKEYSLNFETISPMSETTLPTKKLEFYKTKYQHILLYHNNDDAGKQAMNIQTEEHNIQFIVNPDNLPKDITDISKELGYETAVETIHNLLYT